MEARKVVSSPSFQKTPESVLEAFCRQAGIDPASYEQSQEYDTTHGRATFHRWFDPRKMEWQEREIISTHTKADARIGEANLSRALAENPVGRSTDLVANANISIPRRQTNADIEQQTIPHPNMAKYDHSLEMNRWKGNGGGDGIEMGDLTSEGE